MPQKIIFDCDNTMGLPLKEVDDGLTLLYLLGVPELVLLGITTTFGNGTIDEVFHQTTQLTDRLRLTIPVLKGAGSPNQEPNTPAAQFLLEMVNRYPGEITLLATGPLGNIATAARLDSNFFDLVQRVVTMGGYTEPLKLGYRNLQELNFSAHPKAALEVLSAPCPVTVMSGQACLDAPYRWRDIQHAAFWPPNIKRILRRWLLAFGLYCGIRSFYLWDLLPAVYLTQPNLFINRHFQLGSNLQDLQRGMLVESDQESLPTINLPEGIKDSSAFYQDLKSAWRRTASEYPLDRL